jgi:hypothetical protein
VDTDTASQLVYEALAYGVAGDTEGAFDKLNSVCETADGPRMYGVCCGLAEAGAHMLRKLYGDQAPKSPEDGMFILQELEPGAVDADPAKAFSVRFLTDRAESRKVPDYQYMAYLIRAWNAVRADRPLSRIQQPTDAPMPMPK